MRQKIKHKYNPDSLLGYEFLTGMQAICQKLDRQMFRDFDVLFCNG